MQRNDIIERLFKNGRDTLRVVIIEDRIVQVKDFMHIEGVLRTEEYDCFSINEYIEEITKLTEEDIETDTMDFLSAVKMYVCSESDDKESKDDVLAEMELIAAMIKEYNIDISKRSNIDIELFNSVVDADNSEEILKAYFL